MKKLTLQDQFTRLADRCLGSCFIIDPPAPLRDNQCGDGLMVSGSFRKNDWVLFGLPDPRSYSRDLVTSPVVFPEGHALEKWNGKKGFTNDEIVDFVRDACAHVYYWRPQTRREKIAAFEEMARSCGWTEPTPPAAETAGFSPAAYIS